MDIEKAFYLTVARLYSNELVTLSRARPIVRLYHDASDTYAAPERANRPRYRAIG